MSKAEEGDSLRCDDTINDKQKSMQASYSHLHFSQLIVQNYKNNEGTL